ncbi:DUF5995 family protein [Actinoplanes sp. NBRC 103695]|uniref:DUF5995 family protein n=1 Tax=Actinoplanes sp. NBRC 103695 TaxID=3032202 RepID=UPI0024A233AB|nr:DUF5995 family protein [Actinoplanes sp. NBRC 103695]GLY95828.1 hypothetical protein Acsp02_30830 [Actinoplanes sp. NBRC 103695]
MTESVWGPVHQDMCALLTRHPEDVPAVVDQLAKLQDVLERIPPLMDGNPLADFNRLYLRITTSVLERLYEGRFADPQFLSRLDVEFAARYFDALRSFGDGSSGCPRVWSVLFTRMAGPDPRPLPSAAAGVNAHINFDLPFALVTTFDHIGSDPVDDNDQHLDYLQINDIFAEAIPDLRRGYLEKWQLLLDTMNGDLDDWWQGEVVEYTRNVAWRNAQKLWACRHDLASTAKERERLDGTAAALGRLLLSPLGTFLQ